MNEVWITEKLAWERVVFNSASLTVHIFKQDVTPRVVGVCTSGGLLGGCSSAAHPEAPCMMSSRVGALPEMPIDSPG